MARKHRTSTTNLLSLVTKRANELRDARIDAAIVEYTEILMNWESVDFRDLEARISDAKQGGFPPEPRWHANMKTVENVPEAKGDFKW